MRGDGVPRLRLIVIADARDAGPRLCRGCGGPLMPSVKSSAVFCSSGVPFAPVASAAAHAGEDRGGPGRPDGGLPGVRRELDGRGGTSCLGAVLLSPLSQTGMAPAAHAAGRGVRPRAPLQQSRSTRRARTPWQPFPDRRMVPSDAYSRRVDGMKGAAPGPVRGACGCPETSGV